MMRDGSLLDVVVWGTKGLVLSFTTNDYMKEGVRERGDLVSYKFKCNLI